MINWIEATKENIKKYLFENNKFSKGKTGVYVFLTELKTIFAEYFPVYEKELLTSPFDEGMGYFSDDKVTHFALRSEYEAILPKEGKE